MIENPEKVFDTHILKVYITHIMEIAEYIKDIRHKLGMTQEQFAQLLSSKRYNIANYETGRTIPPGNVLLKIQALDPDRQAA